MEKKYHEVSTYNYDFFDFQKNKTIYIYFADQSHRQSLFSQF